MARLVAVGTCKSCGKQFVRPVSCTHAACDCTSVHEVPLKPALILPPRYMRQIQRVSELSGIAVEKLVDGLLKEASKAVLRGLTVEHAEVKR